MKIVIAMNAFKGSMTSMEAAEAVKAGFGAAMRDVSFECMPIADGGDGALEAFERIVKAKRVRKKVRDAIGRPVIAEYLLSEDGGLAVVELARASGLAMLKDKERDPLKATTYGTGELIKDAIRRGAREIIVGIGGSATNDGGAGIAAAMGYRFLDAAGKSISPGGGELGRVVSIRKPRDMEKISGVKITVACDVTNPLLGEAGASAVYSPQKGADKKTVKILEQNMAAFAKVVARDMGKDLRDAPGAGAAGGAGFGLMTFLNARMELGIELISRLSNLDRKIADADLVITGEGFMDSQSARGKGPFGVLKLAMKSRVPVFAFCGGVDGERALLDAGFAAVIPIVNRPMPLGEAMAGGPRLLEEAAFRTAAIAASIADSMKKGRR